LPKADIRRHRTANVGEAISNCRTRLDCRLTAKAAMAEQQTFHLEASSKTPEGAVYFLGKLLTLDV
jgi:hypothetical protein